MTLVYERGGAGGPVTHAFVIGCGRFAGLPPEAARKATVAGAREIVRFLLAHADDLVAPLATIECLLSDPDVARGDDELKLGAYPNDPRGGSDAVDAALAAKGERAGELWLDRCNPGDHLFFYMSSHGVADQDYTAAALFEDVRLKKYNKWGQSLNVNVLASNLPLTGAGGCWVFLDACQEIIPSLLGQNEGASGIILITGSAAELATTAVRSVALVGSRFGQKGWAPPTADPPYFTQALIRGFNACVEADAGGGWAVTGQQLLFKIPDVANAAFGNAQLVVQPLVPFAQAATLMRVADPKIPVVVRTKTPEHMLEATAVRASDDGGAPPIVATQKDLAFFLEVPADGRRYQAQGDFKNGVAYPPREFFGRPCAQIVELTP